jgi:hypothetical protein
MAENDPDDLNVANLTETRSRRAPDADRAGAELEPRLPGTKWPGSAGLAVLGGIVLMGLAAWKFACRSSRHLPGSESKNDSA